MREILFRGKRIDDGKWVYGHYVHQHGANMIYLPNGVDYECGFDYYHIDPYTLGQYTGLTDKNGTKIFEGDILSVTVREYTRECGMRKFTGNTVKTVWAVEYAERRTQGNGFFVFGKDRRFSLGLTKSVIYNASPEIIGNIHDHPELLKGGADNG